MSVPLPPRPPRPSPRPIAPAGPDLRARVAQRIGERMPGWGWLEAILVSQTLFPGLLFIPGIAKVRIVIRMAVYLIIPLAWFMIARDPKQRPGATSFPARPWLLFCLGWLGLSILHPNVNSFLSATAQMALYVAIFSPAFWAPAALASHRQIARLLAILFLCNALSTLVGIGQVYRPETFNPPELPKHALTNLVYETTDGRMILRPCGLTDSPGGACAAGTTTALIGLCWALRPIAFWKRLASGALALTGVAIIYFTHVRVNMVMLIVSLLVLIVMFLLQRNARQAVMLAVGSVGALGGALAWVAVSAGAATLSRFATLIDGDPVKLYRENRMGFVQQAFEDALVHFPLGYGMGWWGMIYMYFGSERLSGTVWVELMWQAWAYDGGFPLLIGYVGAIGLALFDSLRIALTSADRELAYWAAVVFALNLSAAATCFSYVTFLSPIGVQFWLLAAAVHAADIRSRSAQPPRVETRRA